MNEFKIKNGLIINDTQAITGVTNLSGLTSNSASLTTVGATKQYIDSKLGTGGQNTTVIYNSGGTLSGTTNFTFDKTSLYVNNNINTTYGGMTNLGGFYINLINGTGVPSVKGKLVTYKVNPVFDYGVYTVDVQSNGNVICGGAFSYYGFVPQKRIISLMPDGSKNTGFTVGAGFDLGVTYLKVLSDNKILVGGNFDYYDNMSYYRFIKLNSDGAADITFNVGDGLYSMSPGYAQPLSIDVQSNGNIIVGGSFTNYSGATHNRVMMLNSNGYINSGFTGTAANGNVKCVKVQTDDKILLGGDFTTYNGTSKKYITRILSNGSNDSSFVIGTGFNNSVYGLDIYSDGSIIAVGGFSTYNGTGKNYIVKMTSGGTIDSSFNVGTGFNNYAYCTAIQNDGKVLVGGPFTVYNSTYVNGLVRLNTDGSIDATFNTGTGFDNAIYSIKIQPDSKILVCGDFTTYNGLIEKYIVRLNPDGTRDETFNSKESFTFKYFPAGQMNITIPYIGVVAESNIPSGQTCKVVINGVCEVLLGASSDPVKIGDIISSYTSVNDGDLGYTDPNISPQWMIGRALEDGVAGNTIKCLMLSKDVQGIDTPH